MHKDEMAALAEMHMGPAKYNRGHMAALMQDLHSRAFREGAQAAQAVANAAPHPDSRRGKLVARFREASKYKAHTLSLTPEDYAYIASILDGSTK